MWLRRMKKRERKKGKEKKGLENLSLYRLLYVLLDTCTLILTNTDN